MIKPYGISCVQTVTRVVTDQETRDQRIHDNLKRCMELVDFLASDARYSSRVVLFPEFFLTGVPETRSHEDYLMRSIRIPGKETDIMGEKAKKYGMYLIGAAFEIDEKWPGRCFNTAFIIDPEGKVALKYRKNNDTQFYAPTNTNPGDVYSKYVEVHGEDSIFPVLDTPYGKFACLICYDLNFPEIARILAMRGAEVIFVPSGDGYSFAKQHRLMRRARAYENSVYIVTATHGKFKYGIRPADQQAGNSEITDFEGNIVVTADGPGEATVSGVVNLQALREKRSRLNFFNFLVGFRGSLYAKYYEKEAKSWPLDHWVDRPMTSNAEALEVGKEILERLYEKGIYNRP